jgi:hypothetical protein
MMTRLCFCWLGLLTTEAVSAPPPSAPRYYRLKAVTITDNQGFGRPVEVARLLIPANWRAEGGIFWDSEEVRCPYNIIKPRWRAISPDGFSGVEWLPGRAWTAVSDPMMQQVLRQQAAARTGCDPGPVIGTSAYVSQTVVPNLRLGARVLDARPLSALTKARQQKLNAAYAPLVRAGYVRTFRTDSAAVHISYSQGGRAVEEWINANIVILAMPSANTAALLQGQMLQNATMYSIMLEPMFAVRAPGGQFDNELAATIIASMRPNPQYEAAVSQFLSNMGDIARRGAMDRSRIWTEAGRQISATITQSYQTQQAVQDRAAAQFSQSIRGVESYYDPRSGKRVELTGGYDNAWVSPRGEYLVSNSPGFNPAVELRETWTPLRKVR